MVSLLRVPDAVLKRHHVRVGTDNAFQRRARLLQARGLPIGTHRGKELDSRLDGTHARASLPDFLTEGIRDVVRHAVRGPGRTDDQLIDEDRDHQGRRRSAEDHQARPASGAWR